MYFIELLVKYLKKDRVVEILDDYDKNHAQNPLEEIPEEVEYEKCEHIFMPVDSTGEILACTKCGLIKKKPN